MHRIRKNQLRLSKLNSKKKKNNYKFNNNYKLLQITFLLLNLPLNFILPLII